MTSYHVHIDVRGALVNWGEYELTHLFRYEDGRRLNATEARSHLVSELERGRLVLPCCPCDNFDYAGGGCLGHAN